MNDACHYLPALLALAGLLAAAEALRALPRRRARGGPPDLAWGCGVGLVGLLAWAAILWAMCVGPLKVASAAD